jgi:hypothetical protein
MSERFELQNSMYSRDKVFDRSIEENWRGEHIEVEALAFVSVSHSSYRGRRRSERGNHGYIPVVANADSLFHTKDLDVFVVHGLSADLDIEFCM